MKNPKTVLAFERDGKVHFTPKEYDSSFEIEDMKTKKAIRDKLVAIAEKAEINAKKVKAALIDIAQEKEVKLERALKDRDQAVGKAKKSHEEADEAAMNAINEAVDAERKLLVAKDAVVNATAKEKSELANCIEISSEDCTALIDQVDGQDNMIISIKKGAVIAEEIPAEVLWNDIKNKVQDILKKTDRIVSIPDYHINGKLITKEQLVDISAYRKRLWTIENDFKNTADIVWPKAPSWLN